MRVSQVICLYPPEHNGGAPQQARRLARELARLGHHPSVFAGSHDPLRPMLDERREDDGGINVTRVNTRDAFVESDDRNWHHPEVEHPFHRFLERERPDVVHFHAIQSLGGSLLPMARAHGARVVVTIHDLWWFCARLFGVDREGRTCISVVAPGSCACEAGPADLARRNQRLRDDLRSADVVITPSPSLRDRVRAHGVGVPVETVSNGVDRPSRASSRRAAPAHRDPAAVRLVYSGGTHLVKGWPVLVTALRLLHEQGVRFHADLYGVDEHVLRDGRAADLLDLPVSILPPFLPGRLDDVMAAADIVVVPSLFESSSLVVREALVRGVAVVATESGGPEEVLRHEENGLLVPVGDPGALAAAVARLALDAEFRSRLAAAGGATSVPGVDDQMHRVLALYEAPPSTSRPIARAPSSTSDRGRTVLFIAGIEGAPLRYRVHHAVEQLRLRGTGSTIRHYADPRAARDIETADALVVYRAAATRELVSIIRRAHQRGIPVRFDVDDLIFEPELSRRLDVVRALPLGERKMYLDGVQRYRAALEECGAGLASTPAIARHMEALGIPASVHPNGIGTSLAVASEMARREPKDGAPFTVGYFSGTKTHDDDLAAIGPVLGEFLGRHPDARLVTGGLLTVPAVLRLRSDQIERVPFVSWPALPRHLRRIDVNVVPLAPTVFNEAKSANKWGEAALVDVATIATPTEPFAATIANGTTGFLAGSADEWLDALELSFQRREQLARVGRQARRAAFVAGSPWLLGERLEEVLWDGPPANPREAGRWPSDVAITSLEPPDLWPGLQAGGPGHVVGGALGTTPLELELARGPGPLARVDVLTATHRRAAAAPLTLRATASGVVRTVTATPDEVGDNGWTAFAVEPPLDAPEGVLISVEGSLDDHTAIWLDRSGDPVIRTFHQPRVPPTGVSVWDELSRWGSIGPGGRWRARRVVARAAWRRARYWWRSLGPVGGTRRILVAVGRRARVYLSR